MSIVSKAFSWIVRLLMTSLIVVSMSSSSWAQKSGASSKASSVPPSTEGCKYTKPLTGKQVSGNPALKCARSCTGSVRISQLGMEKSSSPSGKLHSPDAVGVVGEELALEFAADGPRGGDD